MLWSISSYHRDYIDYSSHSPPICRQSLKQKEKPRLLIFMSILVLARMFLHVSFWRLFRHASEFRMGSRWRGTREDRRTHMSEEARGKDAVEYSLYALSSLTSGLHVTPASTVDDWVERKMSTRTSLHKRTRGLHPIHPCSAAPS